MKLDVPTAFLFVIHPICMSLENIIISEKHRSNVISRPKRITSSYTIDFYVQR